MLEQLDARPAVGADRGEADSRADCAAFIAGDALAADRLRGPALFGAARRRANPCWLDARRRRLQSANDGRRRAGAAWIRAPLGAGPAGGEGRTVLGRAATGQ